MCDFGNSSMYNYQSLESAWMMKNGIDPDRQPEEKTEKEFDDQYKRVAEILSKRPH